MLDAPIASGPWPLLELQVGEGKREQRGDEAVEIRRLAPLRCHADRVSLGLHAALSAPLSREARPAWPIHRLAVSAGPCGAPGRPFGVLTEPIDRLVGALWLGEDWRERPLLAQILKQAEGEPHPRRCLKLGLCAAKLRGHVAATLERAPRAVREADEDDREDRVMRLPGGRRGFAVAALRAGPEAVEAGVARELPSELVERQRAAVELEERYSNPIASSSTRR